MGYVVAQLAQWFAGFPAEPWTLVTLMFPSLWLAFSFVLLMVSIHHYASEERKIWSHMALVLAVMYTTLNSTVYFVQLNVVLPLTLAGEASRVQFLVLSNQWFGIPGANSFMYGVDAFGYGLMSLSTLFAAPVFVGGGFVRWTKWALAANGLLAPTLFLQLVVPAVFGIDTLWAITFPLSTALLAALFRRCASSSRSDS